MKTQKLVMKGVMCWNHCVISAKKVLDKLLSVIVIALLMLLLEPRVLKAQVNLPEDEGRHRTAKMEMWNIYGHLVDESGAQIGITASFFTGKYLFFRGNAAIVGFSDEARGILLHGGKFFIPIFSSVKHTERALSERYGDNTLMKTDSGDYQLSMKVGDYGVSLDLKLKKKYMPSEGDGVLAPEDSSAKRYTFPRLDVDGSIDMEKGESRKVTGMASLDHVWASSMEEDHDVFVVHRNDTTDIYLFFRHDKNGQGPMEGSFADISYPDTAHISESDYQFDILGWWTKPRTKRKYPSGWHLVIPSRNMDIKLLPTFSEQEMTMMGRSWWSGTAIAHGKISGKDVSGRAWAILQGYK